MSGSAHPGPQAAEEARGGGAREPRAVAGLLRRHGHPAHVSVHRALRDEPGRQGQVRRAVRRPLGQLRRADHRAARHDARGLGARRPAGRGGHRCRHRARRQEAEQSEVDAAAAQAAAERAKRVAGRGRRRLRRTGRGPGRDRGGPRPRAGYAGAARYEIDERGLVVHIVADAVLFDAEEAVLRPEGRAILDAVAPTLTVLPNVLRRRGSRQPPAGHRPAVPGRPTGSCRRYRATTVLRYLAGDGVPEPRMSAPATAPPGRWSPRPTRTAITVNRRVDIVVLSTASAEANALLPGIDAATSRSHAMSTKEKADETDEATAQGRQEEADPDPARRDPRRGRSGLLLPVLRSGEAAAERSPSPAAPSSPSSRSR